MYDFTWTASSNDAVWAFIGARLRDQGVAAPLRLSRELPLEAFWRSPGLIFGQTCGYPYRHGLSDLVDPIATPVYAFDGCEGPRHCSFIVVNRHDSRRELAAFRGARAAMNGRDSNTGMNLFRAALAPLAKGGSFFSEVVLTGAHAASVAAVATGASDIAAIDCVTFGLLKRGRPELVAEVRVLAQTPSSPALPFIASLTQSVTQRALARDALFAALNEGPLRSAWETLGVVGAESLSGQAYQRIDDLEADAATLGYTELA